MRELKVGKSYALTPELLDEMSKDYDEMIEELLKEGKQVVTALFNDLPGSAIDKKCRKIFERHGGKSHEHNSSGRIAAARRCHASTAHSAMVMRKSQSKSSSRSLRQ